MQPDDKPEPEARPPRYPRTPAGMDAEDIEWVFGGTPFGLRYSAAAELAAEFGSDITEWLI